MKLRAQIVIYGIVQGVWFRVNTKNKAEQLNITGWVRNTSDGNVEALFEGEESNINEIIEWCHHGPPSAMVEKVEIKKSYATNEFNHFFIK